jgi:hypothetical protein
MAADIPTTSNTRELGNQEDDASSTDRAASHVDGKLHYRGVIIRDEEIIAVVKAEERYIIFSLSRASDSKPFDFQTTETTSLSLPRSFLDLHLLPLEHFPPTFLESGLQILVSTKSGSGLALDFVDVLRSLLAGLGFKDSGYDIVETTSAESLKDFAKSTLLAAATRGQKQTVLLLSGDGGVVDIVNGLAEVPQKSRYGPHALRLVTINLSTAAMSSLLLFYSHLAQAMRSSTPSINIRQSHPYTFKVFELSFAVLRNLYLHSKHHFLQEHAFSQTKARRPIHWKITLYMVLLWQAMVYILHW